MKKETEWQVVNVKEFYSKYGVEILGPNNKFGIFHSPCFFEYGLKNQCLGLCYTGRNKKCITCKKEAPDYIVFQYKLLVK